MFRQTPETTSIVFFTKTLLQWWNAETQVIQNFEFPQETVVDLDIVNEEGFQNSFSDWLKQTNQKPQSLIVILAEEVYFTKDFAPTTDKQAIDILQQQFCELVPFDNILCKSFQVEAALRVFAINKGIYEIVVKTLSEQNFTLENLYPQFLFPVDFSQGILPEHAKAILPLLESVKDHGIFDPKQVKEQEQKKFIKKQFAVTKEVGIAVAIFVFLIAVLGVLIWNTRRENQALQKTVNQQNLEMQNAELDSVTPVATISPTVIPVASVSASPTVLTLASVRVQILNGTDQSGKADEVAQNLKTAGAQQVVTGNASETNAGKTLIVVKSSVPDGLREQIINELLKTTTGYSIQESSESSMYDVVMTIGKTGLL